MSPADTLTAVAGAVPDTWPSVIKHIFDSIWGVVGVSAGSFLVGWLALKRPAAVDRLISRPQQDAPGADAKP